MHVWIYLFFFFNQKTADEMRISDWSSDVCSSDLETAVPAAGDRRQRRLPEALPGTGDPPDLEIELAPCPYQFVRRQPGADPAIAVLQLTRIDGPPQHPHRQSQTQQADRKSVV